MRIARKNPLCTRALVCLVLYLNYYADDALRYDDTVVPPALPAAIDEFAATEAS